MAVFAVLCGAWRAAAQAQAGAAAGGGGEPPAAGAVSAAAAAQASCVAATEAGGLYDATTFAFASLLSPLFVDALAPGVGYTVWGAAPGFAVGTPPGKGASPHIVAALLPNGGFSLELPDDTAAALVEGALLQLEALAPPLSAPGDEYAAPLAVQIAAAPREGHASETVPIVAGRVAPRKTQLEVPAPPPGGAWERVVIRDLSGRGGTVIIDNVIVLPPELAAEARKGPPPSPGDGLAFRNTAKTLFEADGPYEVETAVITVPAGSRREPKFSMTVWAPVPGPPAPSSNASEAAESFPVVAFHHGAGAVPEFYSMMLRQAASHGLLVVAPTSASVTLDFTTLGNNMLRAYDAAVAASASDEASPLFGRVNASAGLGLAGHSMGGGATVAAATARSHRKVVKAAVALHPAAVGNARRLVCPAMFVGGSEDFVTPTWLWRWVLVRPAQRSRTLATAFLEIAGAAHTEPMDSTVSAPSARRGTPYLVAFMRHALAADSAARAFLFGPAVAGGTLRADDATLSRRELTLWPELDVVDAS